MRDERAIVAAQATGTGDVARCRAAFCRNMRLTNRKRC